MKTVSLIIWMAVGAFAGYHIGDWYSERMIDRSRKPGVVTTITEQRDMETAPIMMAIFGALAPLYFRNKDGEK